MSKVQIKEVIKQWLTHINLKMKIKFHESENTTEMSVKVLTLVLTYKLNEILSFE